jgi:hypothetical protein
MGLKHRPKTEVKTAKARATVRGTWASLMDWIAKGHRNNPVCKG